MKKKSPLEKLMRWLRKNGSNKPRIVLTEKKLIETMKATYDHVRVSS